MSADLSCHACCEAVSARLDGESHPWPDDAVDQHLLDCRHCASFAAQANAVHRHLRKMAAEVVPIETDHLLAWRHQLRRPRWPAWRIALIVIGLAEFVVAVGHLLGSEDVSHLLRERALWEGALALGLLAIAHRPARAIPVATFGVTLGTALAIVATADLLGGGVPAGPELHHLVELAGMALVVVAAWMRPALE